MRRVLPSAIGLLGVVLAALALAVWLYPTQSRTTTVSETSTTRVAGGGAKAPSATRVTKTTTTTAPGEARSETLPGLIVGIGVLLVLVAAFWNRIQEIGLPGGGSIKLKDAEAPTVDLDDVAEQLRQAGAGPAEGFAGAMTSLASSIIAKADEVYEKGTGVVPVDLGAGDKWLLPNLYFLALVFERWTHVEVLVFTRAEAGTTDRFFVACTSPRDLRRKLDAVRPELASAATGVAARPLAEAGSAFFGQLQAREAARGGAPAQPPTWVSEKVLLDIASDALILESVEVDNEDNISRNELLEILAFPHRFVPITHGKRLVIIVDPTKLARKLARSAIR
jgi:hypothetical protein